MDISITLRESYIFILSFEMDGGSKNVQRCFLYHERVTIVLFAATIVYRVFNKKSIIFSWIRREGDRSSHEWLDPRGEGHLPTGRIDGYPPDGIIMMIAA